MKSPGMFFLKDACNYLNASNVRVEIGGSYLWISPSRLAGWGRRGFFPIEKTTTRIRKLSIDFDALITSRLISFFLMQGESLGRIEGMHQYLREQQGETFPFTMSLFWNDQDGIGERDPRWEAIGRNANVEYDEEIDFVAKWYPSPGIQIDPRIKSGASCVKNTGIMTAGIWGMHHAGDSVSLIADNFNLMPLQVRLALEWEELLLKVAERRGSCGICGRIKLFEHLRCHEGSVYCKDCFPHG